MFTVNAVFVYRRKPLNYHCQIAFNTCILVGFFKMQIKQCVYVLNVCLTIFKNIKCKIDMIIYLQLLIKCKSVL